MVPVRNTEYPIRGIAATRRSSNAKAAVPAHAPHPSRRQATGQVDLLDRRLLPPSACTHGHPRDRRRKRIELEGAELNLHHCEARASLCAELLPAQRRDPKPGAQRNANRLNAPLNGRKQSTENCWGRARLQDLPEAVDADGNADEQERTSIDEEEPQRARRCMRGLAAEAARAATGRWGRAAGL